MLATSAAFSRDGTVLAARTYTDAYLWRVHDGDVAAALRARPLHVALPLQPQGEGIAIDGNRLLLDSEHQHTAVLSVPFAVAAPRSAAATPAARSAAARSRSVPSAVSSASAPVRHAGRWTTGLVLLVLLTAGSIGWWSGQWRGGRRR